MKMDATFRELSAGRLVKSIGRRWVTRGSSRS